MYQIRVHFHRTICQKNASLRFNGMWSPICSDKYWMDETRSETTIQNTDNRTHTNNHEFLFSSDCDGNVALTKSDRQTWLDRQRLAQTAAPYVTREAQPFVEHFVGNSHYSPNLCEFTTVVIWLHTPANKQTSCWCEQLHHMNISPTWFLCFAASTHIFKIHKAYGNVSWPATGAFLDACRWPWFKTYIKVSQHAVMIIQLHNIQE